MQQLVGEGESRFEFVPDKEMETMIPVTFGAVLGALIGSVFGVVMNEVTNQLAQGRQNQLYRRHRAGFERRGHGSTQFLVMFHCCHS